MKVKKLLSLLAAAAMAVTAFTGAMSVSAVEANGKIGDNLTWTLDANGKLTISGNGEMVSPEVTQLDSPGDYSNIYTYKKEHMEDINEVVIEDGVTSIGYSAFYKMPNLETVVLPKTISKFDSWDSSSNGSLPKYDYNNYAFAECTSLKNLTLTEGMTAIGAYSFYGCTSLDNVRIPTTITEWGYYSFSECSKLKNVTLPEGLTKIGGSVFSDTAIESIVIPSTITAWESANIRDRALDLRLSGWPCGYAFARCDKLSSVTFTDGLKIIANNPFYDCKALKKVVIPASVTNLKYAFSGCIGLQEAYIEEGTVIGTYDGGNGKQESDGFNWAFYYCQDLKKLEIPAGIATTFNNLKWDTGCESLQDVYLHSKEYGLPYTIDENESVKVHCYTDSKYYGGSSASKKINIEEDIASAKDTLSQRLKEAKAVKESDYTEESYAALKTAIDNAEKFDESYTGVLPMQWAAEDLETAIKGLEKKPENTPVNTPSNSQQQTPNKTTPQTPTTARPTKSTRSAAQVKKDKSAAKKAMKQAKITKLTAKSKAKKKIAVSWKKVKNAKGYQVQVSAKKNFKKVIYNKSLTKNKLTIKSSKIKSKKTYYVRVRAYATYKDANNATKKIYSKWVKKIRKVKAK